VVVSGEHPVLTDLNFRFDGATCSTAIGSTTVGLDHTWVGDLVVTLTSPHGTAVTLINRAGGPGNSGNNFCQTLLDDGASTSIQSVAVSDAPFTGTFTPANPLSAFNRENPNGTWTLTVQDLALFDTGSVRAFSLIVASADPAEELGDLQDLVASMGIHHGITNALESKLQNALDALAADDTAGACYWTQSFLNLVKAQTGKKITRAQAMQLTAAANDIRDQLGC
jgi:subtilisin-like proprotein convertase family protein